MSSTKIILAILTICHYSCNIQIDPDCIQTGQAAYNFHLPVTISPAIDTFNIGDTITIVSEFTEEMQEIHSGEFVKLIDWSFYPKTTLHKIDGIETIDTVLNTFDVLIDSTYSYSFYTFNSGKVILNGQYYYENGIYKLEYKLIPTEAGLYLHSMGSAIYSSAPDSEFVGKCSNTPVSAYCKMIESENNNELFLLDSPDEKVHTWYERRDKDNGSFNNNAGYCFYVR